MKFLFFSDEGMSLSLAIRVAEEGNDVYFYVHSPKEKQIGDGLIQKVDDYTKVLSKDTIVVFDMVGYGRLADRLKKSGYKVFGASILADKLELDRAYGTLVMQTAGIKTPPTYVFKDFDEAIEFVKNKPKAFVFKPSGNMSTALTYVSYNYKDTLNLLYYLKKTKFPKVEFELQEKIEGIECSCEGLFNGLEWVDGWCNITLERKRLMNDDAGENTGSMGEVVKVLPNQTETSIFKKTLSKLTPFLREAGYQGFLDINCIYFNGTPFGLEFTSRFGYGAIYTMLELVNTEISKIIYDTATSKLNKVETNKDLFSITVRCILENDKIPRLIQNIRNYKHVHLLDAKIDEKGDLVTAGKQVALVSSTGYTIPDAQERVYYLLLKKLDRFGINDLRFRTDIGINANISYQRLKSWGLV